MPKGVAKDPSTDKRRQIKAGGRPKTLPPAAVKYNLWVSPELHAALVAANPDEVRQCLTQHFCASPVVKQP